MTATALTHGLNVGDRVKWSDRVKPDPYGGKELRVESVYPPELVTDSPSTYAERVAVSIGARPDEEQFEDVEHADFESCGQHGVHGKCTPTRHYHGPVAGGAEYRGRELAKNLKKVT